MKPVLKQIGNTIDCAIISLGNNTTIPSPLPAFAYLRIGLFGKDDWYNLPINATTTTAFADFLNGKPIGISSYTLGVTRLDEPLLQLSCGIIQVDYNWFYTTSKPIVFTKNKTEVLGSNLDVKDSILLNNIIYVVDKSKSSSTKLVLTTPVNSTGVGVLTYGEFTTSYIINDCQILQGHTQAIGNLPILECNTKNGCITKDDKDSTMNLWKDLMVLKSAYVKLNCGDILSANELIKDLCNKYASKCQSDRLVIYSLDVQPLNPCTTCG